MKYEILKELENASTANLNHWEREVVTQVKEAGHPVSNKELAESLGVPRKQAKRVRQSIVKKLGLKKGF